MKKKTFKDFFLLKTMNDKLEKIIKTIVYILVLILIVYALVDTNLTGFSIGSSEVIVTGGFVSTILLILFMILLIFLKKKAKTYKPKKEQ